MTALKQSVNKYVPRAKADTLAVLGRREHAVDLLTPLLELRKERRVLVTGGAGSIGSVLAPLLRDFGIKVTSTDLDPFGVPMTQKLDVRDEYEVLQLVGLLDPSLIIHLAGAKHAPRCELDPLGTATTNVEGTHNVLNMGRRVVLASTCKACNPQTVYGATKLIGERAVLHAGGSVARFYNVVETQENVFEIWRDVPEDQPLPVTSCYRYFISLREAVALVLWASVLPPAIYTIDPGAKQFMADVARALHPGREIDYIAARRGDRTEEPGHASNECMTRFEQPYLLRVDEAPKVGFPAYVLPQSEPAPTEVAV